LLGLANITAQFGQSKRAIVLAGAAQALRGHDERPWESAELNDVIGSCRKSLTDEEFAVAWQRGQTADLTDVIEIALRAGD
jgi:hypothetical protein